MSPFLRVFHAIRGALFWDNPWELLFDYHLFRRRDPIRLLKDGTSLVVNYRNSDMQAAKDILLDGMYDHALTIAFETVMPGQSFQYLNLGANIGAFDLRAWQFAKRRKTTITGAAVEMNTATFARLIFNLEINHLLNILPINAALAEMDGSMICELAARGTGQQAGANTPDAQSAHSVMALSWNTLWKRISRYQYFDLVKVDIEGGERFFLEGLTQEQACKMRHIIIETHSASLNALCHEQLQKMGFCLLDKQPESEKTCISLWRNSCVLL